MIFILQVVSWLDLKEVPDNAIHLLTYIKKQKYMGVSSVVQRDQQCLQSAGKQAQPQAHQSGLGIWHCQKCASDLIPGPGTPYATRRWKKNMKWRLW